MAQDKVTKENFTVRNHYVPQWYQRRFMPPGVNKLFYLDLNPDPIVLPNGRKTFRTALRALGPVSCFKQDHLYTLYFGEHASDIIEKRFFGVLDDKGEKSVDFFSEYSFREGAPDAFNGVMGYLAAQLFRTPKGLQKIKLLNGSSNHQRALVEMQRVQRIYQTMWSEGVWEILRCDNSPTKFIISDTPVTTYNKQIFPLSDEVKKMGNAHPERIGTHTIFPIDGNRCLVITNLQYVRDPRSNPTKIRENPAYFQNRMFDLRKIQTGREIDEEEVLAINYVLKSQSLRYIAAAEKEWLYPEAKLKKQFWSKLGGPYFLHPDPRKVSFTTGIVMGFEGGGSFGHNEYGHFNPDDKRAKALRAKEWSTFQAAKTAWDERDRLAGREPYRPGKGDFF